MGCGALTSQPLLHAAQPAPLQLHCSHRLHPHVLSAWTRVCIFAGWYCTPVQHPPPQVFPPPARPAATTTNLLLFSCLIVFMQTRMSVRYGSGLRPMGLLHLSRCKLFGALYLRACVRTWMLQRSVGDTSGCKACCYHMLMPAYSKRRPVLPPNTSPCAQLIYNKETGRSKGFGFVSFEDERDACDALNDANGRDLDGCESSASAVDQGQPACLEGAAGCRMQADGERYCRHEAVSDCMRQTAESALVPSPSSSNQQGCHQGQLRPQLRARRALCWRRPRQVRLVVIVVLCSVWWLDGGWVGGLGRGIQAGLLVYPSLGRPLAACQEIGLTLPRRRWLSGRTLWPFAARSTAGPWAADPLL